MAFAAAGLPISPDCPTWKRLSRSSPSLAFKVSTIGACSRSASSSTCSRASRAPIPTSSVTAPAPSRTRAAVEIWSSGAVVQRPGGANVAGRAPLGSSWSPRSPGSVSTATPWWARAAFTACSSSSGSWLGVVSVLANTATSANSRSLSTSWKKSLPSSSLGTCPQIASTGACDFLASYRPLSRWIEPGPTVPMHTPSRPVSWAWALTANAAASSCRTPTHSTRSSWRMASVTGLSASPTTPQTWVTPWSASAVTMDSATVGTDRA